MRGSLPTGDAVIGLSIEHTTDLEREGREAFAAGQRAVACPYTFIHSPYWRSKDYESFDREYRWRMDAWMKGWIDAQKANK